MIRNGALRDLPEVLKLVKELAQYEKALDQVNNTLEMMERDGFGPHPIFGFFVYEMNNRIVGLSLYYYRYSTWKGKRLYLEDIIVTETHRGKGIGKLLFERTMKKTLEEGCSGMVWQVLDWNKTAIDFYKKYDSALDGEWINCKLTNHDLEKF